MMPIATAQSRDDPDWVGEDGWYQPHDYWLTLCGLYPLYKYALGLLGNLSGKRVLDCGCGKGHTSVMLAKHHAEVSAFDISEPDLAIASRLAAANGVSIELRTLVFEKLNYPDASFDFAFGACVLHHVNIAEAMAELQRVLKPGGRAVFVENSARNPLLMLARRRLVGRLGIPRYGDDHEHPLRPRDFDTMRANFDGTAKIHYAELVLFRLLDFYVFRRRFQALTRLLRAADKLGQRLPWVREQGYFLIVQLERTPTEQNAVGTVAIGVASGPAVSSPSSTNAHRSGLGRIAVAAICAGLLAWTTGALGKDKNEFRLKNEQAAKACSPEAKTPVPRTREFVDAVKVLPPTTGLYAGLYSIGTTRADMEAFVRKTNKPPPIVFTFHDWISDADFSSKQPKLRTFEDDMEDHGTTPIQLARQLDARGTVLALTWAMQCCDFSSFAWWFGLKKTQINLPRLLQGDFDDYIRKVAQQVKSYQKPIMLSLFSEFNWQGAMAFGRDGTTRISEAEDICGQYGDPHWPDGPERIRDAHIHVIDLFRQEGVKNVTWFMYANSGYMDSTGDDYSSWLHPKYFYPGDDYIDWVGQSTYFIDPKWNRSPSKDAALITHALAPGYAAWGEVTQRPMFLPEFAAVGDKKLNRASILREVMTQVLPSMPRVKAVTLADFMIAEICCQVPRLGEPYADEIAAWRESVGQNPTYIFRLRIGSPDR